MSIALRYADYEPKHPQLCPAGIHALLHCASGLYGNTSEYIRDLVRKDQTEEAKARLRVLIEEGLASGPGRPLTQADEDELLAIARGEID